jgi:hypothetical protein
MSNTDHRSTNRMRPCYRSQADSLCRERPFIRRGWLADAAFHEITGRPDDVLDVALNNAVVGEVF